MEEYYCDSCEFVLQKSIKSNYTVRVSHINYMIMSSLHAQIVYVFQDFVFVLKGSHLHYMDISFFHALIVYVLLGLMFFYENKLHASHVYFCPSCTDCLCFLLLPFCFHKEVTCITRIYISFMHRLFVFS